MNATKRLSLIEELLSKRGIFCKRNWLQELIDSPPLINQEAKLLEEHVLKQIKLRDISSFIDAEIIEKMFRFQRASSFKIFKGRCLAQILEFKDISKPSPKVKDKTKDSIEKIDNKFLTIDEEEEEQESQNLKGKNEKSLYKFLLSNGVEDFFAYEYEKQEDLILDSRTEKQKVILGPEIEVRGGLVFLRKGTMNIL